MKRNTVTIAFFLLSGQLFCTPNNSNLFQFLLKVRVIGSLLYVKLQSFRDLFIQYGVRIEWRY